jgi:hypothetical protein
MIGTPAILTGPIAVPAGVGAVNAEILEYLKMIGILAGVVVFALIALRVWLPKFMSLRRATPGPMQIAYRLALEPRKTLYVVRAGSDYVMLAASEAGVQFLSSLDAAGIEASLQELSPTSAAGFEFASLMRRHGSKPGERAE